MPRFKVKDDVTTTEGATFIKGEVVEGTQRGKSASMINVQRKNKFGTDNTLMLDFDIEKVDDSTPLTNPADFKGAIEESKKTDKTLTIISTIGALGGLYYAYSKKKGFWGYVGFMVLGGIAGSLVANVVTKMKKPKLADATQKDNATASTTSNTQTPIPSVTNVKTPVSLTDTSKMTKAQKIDLIIKNQMLSYSSLGFPPFFLSLLPALPPLRGDLEWKLILFSFSTVTMKEGTLTMRPLTAMCLPLMRVLAWWIELASLDLKTRVWSLRSNSLWWVMAKT